MKVDALRPIDSTRAVRGRAATAGVGGFSLDGAAEPRAAAAASGVAALSSVDALIALQAVPDVTTGRARAARRGRDMLDTLEDVRDGLLVGSVSRATLHRLLALASAARIAACRSRMCCSRPSFPSRESSNALADVSVVCVGRSPLGPTTDDAMSACSSRARVSNALGS